VNDDEMEAQMEYWKSKAKAAVAERDEARKRTLKGVASAIRRAEAAEAECKSLAAERRETVAEWEREGLRISAENRRLRAELAEMKIDRNDWKRISDEAEFRAEVAEAERDEAKAQFWQQRHEWAAATGRNQEIIDGLLAERDDTERTNGPWKCLAETETKLAAAEKERDEWKVEALHHNAEEIRLREALKDISTSRRSGMTAHAHVAFLQQEARSHLGEEA